jgi:hypothetical protein
MKIMSREIPSQVDDTTKLRRILDNSSDPALDYLLSENERTLNSLRRRLRGEYSAFQSSSSRVFPFNTKSMEPRVYIHKKITSPPQTTATQPSVEQSRTLPEFTLISPSETSTSAPSQELSFDTEELYEVEKVNQVRPVPEFVEVTPKQPEPTLEEKETTPQFEEVPVVHTTLPEWQPVTDENIEKTKDAGLDENEESIPEFEQIPSSPTLEKEGLKEQLTTEESIETPIDFLPVEPQKSLIPIVSKQQRRAAKKEQKQKERQEKRLQRLEQKRLKKEQQEKEEEAEFTKIPQTPFQDIQDEFPPEFEAVASLKPPQKKVYREAFKDIESIDEKIAELLYKNGYFSIENLKEATLDDLVDIRGIKRKLAKQIKKEIGQNIILPQSDEFIPMEQPKTRKKTAKKLKDNAEWETYPSKQKTKQKAPSAICTYKEYTLYKRESTGPGRKKTTIHFFSKEKPKKGRPCQLPGGFLIAVNKNTGIPYLKKKR